VSPASKRTGSVPETVRRAVEKTVQSTLGGERLRDAVQDLRTFGSAADDIKKLRAEVQTLRKRVEKLEGKQQKKSSAKKSSKS
jgi:polyhydroxyalkanoate synthesis regulator phasin